MTSMQCPLLLALLPTGAGARAQYVFESPGGASSIVLAEGGVFAVNFSDSSVKLAFTRTTSQPLRFGAGAQAKARSGFAALLDDDGIELSEGSGLLYGGYQMQDVASAQYHFVGAQLDFTHGEYVLAREGESGPLSTDETFDGASLRAFYNGFMAPAPALELLVGLTAGYGHANNHSELSKVEVCEEVTSDGEGGRVQACQDARRGGYREEGAALATANVIWYQRWSRNRLAIGGFARYEGVREDAFVPGVGVFVTEAGSPLKFIGGFTLSFEDDGPRAGLQLGIPF